MSWRAGLAHQGFTPRWRGSGCLTVGGVGGITWDNLESLAGGRSIGKQQVESPRRRRSRVAGAPRSHSRGLAHSVGSRFPSVTARFLAVPRVARDRALAATALLAVALWDILSRFAPSDSAHRATLRVRFAGGPHFVRAAQHSPAATPPRPFIPPGHGSSGRAGARWRITERQRGDSPIVREGRGAQRPERSEGREHRRRLGRREAGCGWE